MSYRSARGGEARLASRLPRPGQVVSQRQALLSLGTVIYAARVADGAIKFGCTSDLYQRIHNLRQTDGRSAELLAFKPGDFAEERDLHESLASWLSRGREYYRPTPEVLAVVNEMRADLHLPSVPA